jgi:glycosyltransferase involved in cell wall biosynthesis
MSQSDDESSGPLMKICFYARVPSRDIFDVVEFYAQDIRALRDLGHDVIAVHTLGRVPLDSDLYYVWWWTWAMEPVIKARLRGKPVIITGTFNYEFPGNTAVQRGSYRGRPWWQQMPIRWSARAATANVFVSEYELRQVSAAFGLRQSYCVPHAVDTTRYRLGSQPRERFLFNVAWSGALNGQRKCLKQIIEALPLVLQEHPDVKLVMAGRPGEYHPILVETAKRLGLNEVTDFRGVISEEEKIDLMQRCAVYLQPSLYEGFGLATAEAMACGAAVVGSPVGAVPEVVGDDGLMVNGESPKEIAHAVNTLLSNEEQSRRLGMHARARVERLFTYERKKQLLGEVLKELGQR